MPVASFTNASRVPPIAGNLAIGNEASYLHFEDVLYNSTPGQTADYWSQLGTTRATNYRVGTGHTGQYSWRVGQTKANYTVPGPRRTFSPDNQLGRYTLSAWVKTEPGSFAAGAGRLSLQVLRADGTVMTGTSAKQEVSFSDTNGKWKYLEATIDLTLVRQQAGLSTGSAGAGPQDERLQITASTSNAGGSTGNPVGYLIDDVRFEPTTSQTKSLTYDIANRLLTSSSDANSLPEYYEYDALNRLKVIRDHLGQILKQYTYHYQQ